MTPQTFLFFFRPDLVETLFMARGQLLSLILARQHQKVADPWIKVTSVKVFIVNIMQLRCAFELVFILKLD